MGETGCGKGALYRDLANSFGLMSIQVNCSSEMRVDTLKNYLLGGVQTGLWICLDNFQVLSSSLVSVFCQFQSFFKEQRLLEKEQVHFQGINFKLQSTYNFYLSQSTDLYSSKIKANREIGSGFKENFRVFYLVDPNLEYIG